MNDWEVQWHTYLIALFLGAMSVFVVANIDSTAGWVYVIVLLLGAMLVADKQGNNAFRNEIKALTGGG